MNGNYLTIARSIQEEQVGFSGEPHEHYTLALLPCHLQGFGLFTGTQYHRSVAFSHEHIHEQSLRHSTHYMLGTIKVLTLIGVS